jgi:hypothetical protein
MSAETDARRHDITGMEITTDGDVLVSEDRGEVWGSMLISLSYRLFLH